MAVALLSGSAAPGAQLPAGATVPALDNATTSRDNSAAYFLILRTIYILIGGDPADLDNASSDTAAGLLAARYRAVGIPGTLVGGDKLTLATNIYNLELQLKTPPSDLSSSAAILLDKTLRSMWADLGLAPSGLA